MTGDHSGSHHAYPDDTAIVMLLHRNHHPPLLPSSASVASANTNPEPLDVAGAVVLLASPAASLINGATLLIDGGWTAR